jgi:hypothetical protein
MLSCKIISFLTEELKRSGHPRCVGVDLLYCHIVAHRDGSFEGGFRDECLVSVPTVAEVGADEEIINQVTRDPEAIASRILRSASDKVELDATEESHFRIKVSQYMGGRASICFSVREVIQDLGASLMETTTKATEDVLAVRRLHSADRGINRQSTRRTVAQA